jgi:hypothetical protein
MDRFGRGGVVMEKGKKKEHHMMRARTRVKTFGGKV